MATRSASCLWACSSRWRQSGKMSTVSASTSRCLLMSALSACRAICLSQRTSASMRACCLVCSVAYICISFAILGQQKYRLTTPVLILRSLELLVLSIGNHFPSDGPCYHQQPPSAPAWPGLQDQSQRSFKRRRSPKRLQPAPHQQRAAHLRVPH